MISFKAKVKKVGLWSTRLWTIQRKGNLGVF